jgi:hypothetical protein
MAIQQHPIPQNVTSFQFRLVGDMTLMQFFQLAGGIVLGLVVYATGLPFFIKWPLIATCVGLGAGMAFLPVEGRPMDKWLLAFIRSIYTPTIFTWQKTIYVPPTPKAAPTPTTVTTPNTPAPVAPATAAVPSQSFGGGTNYAVPSTPEAPKTTTPNNNTIRAPQDVKAPVVQKIHIAAAKPVEEKQKVAAPAQTNSIAPITPKVQSPAGGQNPVFSSTLPIPSTPTTPNTIVGMTLNAEGKILDGAIVEIRHNTETVRATKSNKLGQFLFLKPLDNGVFQLTADHPDYSFKTYSITVNGEIVRPIKLQSIAPKNKDVVEPVMEKMTPSIEIAKEPVVATPTPVMPPIPTPVPAPVLTTAPVTVIQNPPVSSNQFSPTPQQQVIPSPVMSPQIPVAATITLPTPSLPPTPSTPTVKPVTLVDNTGLQLPKNPPAF